MPGVPVPSEDCIDIIALLTLHSKVLVNKFLCQRAFDLNGYHAGGIGLRLPQVDAGILRVRTELCDQFVVTGPVAGNVDIYILAACKEEDAKASRQGQQHESANSKQWGVGKAGKEAGIAAKKFSSLRRNSLHAGVDHGVGHALDAFGDHLTMILRCGHIAGGSLPAGRGGIGGHRLPGGWGQRLAHKVGPGDLPLHAGQRQRPAVLYCGGRDIGHIIAVQVGDHLSCRNCAVLGGVS